MTTDPSILHPILYAGLGGTLLALIVATISNRWSLRIFFLLALRLAIGWHFLFEGLHKIHSHEVGLTETNRPFSSEIYFKVAPGPLGAQMRKQFDDPSIVIESIVKPAESFTAEAFAKLSLIEQAKACPAPVAAELDPLLSATEEAIKTEAEADLKAADAAEAKAIKAADEAEAKALKDADGSNTDAAQRPMLPPVPLLAPTAPDLSSSKTEAEAARNKAKADADDARRKAKADAETSRKDARKRAESFKDLAARDLTAAKAKYARWVYGAEGRNTKVKFISGDAALTAPQRLAHLEWLRQEAKSAEDRQSTGLGNGYGIDSKKAAEIRTDLIAAESDLARDASAFVTELKKDLTGGTAAVEPARTSLGQRLDIVTMWFLVVVGGFLLAGLFTRVACVLGAGFLVMTYLAHPPFPWYPSPPNTEGNPVFINKNVIECLALLALASMPTGRWMGLDALIRRMFGSRRSANPAI